MSTSKVTSDLLRGNTDTMILRLLAERYLPKAKNV